MPTLTIRGAAPMRDVDADFRPGVYLAFGSAMRVVCTVWHRYEMRGMARIPPRPCLFVGNHSGIGVSDVLCMLGAFRARFGLRRRLAGMMHDIFVAMPVVGWFARSFGAVRANPAAARTAFARGYDVVSFPGGDLDSCRPFTAPRDVRFGDHRGYVRLALESGVPIVPMATIGSHWSYLVLPGGDRIAAMVRALGGRSRVLPVTVGALVLTTVVVLAALGILSPAWVLLAVAAALIPTPVRVTSEILEPIDVCAATADIDDPAERIERAHELVHGALSAHVRTMRHRI